MQIKYDRCPNCMNSLQSSDAVCPSCNFDVAGYEEKSSCLRPFTVLQGKYMIGRVIGIGGFGITYIGWDLNLQTYIAIKEYYPESIATRDTSREDGLTQVVSNESKKDIYDKGLKRYVEEAQNLSKFYRLQGIVSVKDFFYENGTGYIVMEYINGINLKEYLNSAGGKLDENTVLSLMKPVLESMYQIHNAGLVHRDISPDNIMVDNEGKIKLIDFGSARGQSAETDKTYTVILKHGYAPSEQYYAKGNQGPWTDIYSICATMYKMLTGQIPPNSIERMENDEYVNPSNWGVTVSPRTEAVLRKGLAVKVNDRYQNIGELLNDLYGTNPVESIGAGIPLASAGAFNNHHTVSPQSMHLSVQPQMESTTQQKSEKKTLFIVLGIVAAIILVAIIILIVSGGKDKDKDKDKTTEETTTEADTEEPGDTEDPDDTTESTEDPDEPELPGYTYEWPSELSDDWHDYQISIDGTIYQFPLPYSEWESKGWRADYLPTYIAANTYDYTTFYNDNMELTVYIANFALNEASVDECFVIGIDIDGDYDEISENAEIILPGNLIYGESTGTDVKTVCGAPDYFYEDDEGTYKSYDYVGDTYEDGLEIETDENDVIKDIRFINSKAPEGVEISASDISTEPPAINELYVAPTGPSTDRFDDIITLDGFSVKLPVPMSELINAGWTLDTATDDYLAGNSYTWTSMEKNGEKIDITLVNYTPNAILPINAYVTEITVDISYCSLEVLFPGGIKVGDPGTTFESLYGDLGDDYIADEEGDYYSVYSSGDPYRHIYAYMDYDDSGLIDSYTYECKPDEIK